MQAIPSSGEADALDRAAHGELASESGRPEVQALLRTLQEKRTQMEGATEPDSELRRQLDRKEADYEELRAKLTAHLAATAPTVESGGNASNLQQLFRETKSALERERKSHQLKAANASTRIAQLESQLGNARKTGQTKTAGVSGYELRNFRWRSTLIILALTALTVFVVPMWQHSLFLATALKVWSTPPHAVAPPVPLPNPAIGTDYSSGVAAASTLGAGDLAEDFPAALSRLDRELGSFPVKAEEVLRAVNSSNQKNRPPPCDFEWTSGEASLRYRGTSKGLSIMASVNDCSNAIARFRQQIGSDSKKPE